MPELNSQAILDYLENNPVDSDGPVGTGCFFNATFSCAVKGITEAQAEDTKRGLSCELNWQQGLNIPNPCTTICGS